MEKDFQDTATLHMSGDQPGQEEADLEGRLQEQFDNMDWQEGLQEARMVKEWAQEHPEWALPATLGAGVLVGYLLTVRFRTPPPTFSERMERQIREVVQQAMERAEETSGSVSEGLVQATGSARQIMQTASRAISKQLDEQGEMAGTVGNLAQLAAAGLALKVINGWANKED